MNHTEIERWFIRTGLAYDFRNPQIAKSIVLLERIDRTTAVKYCGRIAKRIATAQPISEAYVAEKLKRFVEREYSRDYGKVGTELKRIIPRIYRNQNCGCDDYARLLDVYGIATCEERIAEIVDYLVDKSSQLRLSGLIFEPLRRYVAVRWVKRAIRNAKKKCPECN